MFTMRRQFNPVVWRRSFGSVARRYQAQPAVSKIKPLEATVASGNGQTIDGTSLVAVKSWHHGVSTEIYKG